MTISGFFSRVKSELQNNNTPTTPRPQLVTFAKVALTALVLKNLYQERVKSQGMKNEVSNSVGSDETKVNSQIAKNVGNPSKKSKSS